jgi:hypothetical protein
MILNHCMMLIPEHLNYCIETRLYPFNKITPKFVQKGKITYDLSYIPEINMIDNNNE